MLMISAHETSAQETAKDSVTTSSTIPDGLFYVPTVVGKWPEGAQLDSVYFVFKRDFAARRILNRTGKWAVDWNLFVMVDQPDRFYEFEDLEFLEEIGRINGKTRVEGVRIRKVVTGADPVEIREKVRKDVLGRPPSKRLVKELKALHPNAAVH